MTASAGRLTLVATPIGNLGDMSARAIEVLTSVDVLCCEDTRHTAKLLGHLGIRAQKLVAVHEHNEAESAERVIAWLRDGKHVAMVTDAGMPAISDPGERVVAAVAAAGLTVTVVPGASAVPAALAISGLPTQRFVFEGFLARKGAERSSVLSALAVETRTVILYEAPHRLAATAADLARVCGGERRVVLVRELTKLHEEVWRGTLDDLIERAQESVKGECVLVLAGAVAVEVDDARITSVLEARLGAGVSRREAILETVAELGVTKNRVYDLANDLSKPAK